MQFPITVKTVLQNLRVDASRRTMRIVLAPRTRNTRAIGLRMYEEKCTRVPDACRGGSLPGSHVARARTETSIPGFRWGILVGYLWKLNPPVYRSPGKPPAFSTSTALRRVSNGLPWWSPFIKCPLSESLGELSPSLPFTRFAASRGFSASFSRFSPRPRQTSFLRIPS